MSSYRGGESYRRGAGRRPSREYSPPSRDGHDSGRDRDGRPRERSPVWERNQDPDQDGNRDRGRDRPRSRDQDGNQDGERDRPVSRKAMPPPTGPKKLLRPTINTSPSLVQKSPTLAPGRLAISKSPSLAQSPTTVTTDSISGLGIMTPVGTQPAYVSSSTSIVRKPQVPVDGDLLQMAERILDIFVDHKQMKSQLENAGRMLNKRRADYQKQREKTPDATSAIESFRGVVERAEKGYKAMEKSWLEHGERQRQELAEYISRFITAFVAHAPQAKSHEATTEDLITRVAALEGKIHGHQDHHRQLEDQIVSQKLSFEKREERLASSQQAFEKKIEEKLESQRTESKKEVEAIRKVLSQLGRDHSALKADVVRLEKALQASQEISLEAKKMASDAQKAAADTKKDTRQAATDSQKAIAESQKAMREAQKQRDGDILQPIKHNIEVLTSNLAVAEARLDELDTQQKTFPDDLAEVRQALLNPHEETLRQLSRKVEEQGQRLNEVDPEQFDKLFWDIDQIQSRLNALEAHIKQGNGQSPAKPPSAGGNNAVMNTQALEVANEAVKLSNATSKRLEGFISLTKESSKNTASTFGNLIDSHRKRIAAIEAKLAGRQSPLPLPSDLTEMQSKLEQVSVKQEELCSSLTETAGNTANLSARIEAQDQMHRNLQSQYNNLQTRELHDAIVRHVSRSYQDDFAEIRKDQNTIKNDQADMKKDIAEIKTSLKGLQQDGREPKRQRIGADVSFRNGNY